MRSFVAIRMAALSSLLLPAIASGQSRSLLWLAEPAGRLVLEQEATGSLSASDHFAPSDALFGERKIIRISKRSPLNTWTKLGGQSIFNLERK